MVNSLTQIGAWVEGTLPGLIAIYQVPAASVPILSDGDVGLTAAGKIWPHRLSSGFPSDLLIAATTGTVPAVRNEAGVVTYPDGRRYAVAVFTRADSLADRLPDVDSSIGAAGHRAVEHLRALSSQRHPRTSRLAKGSHPCPAAERLQLLPPLSDWAARPPRA